MITGEQIGKQVWYNTWSGNKGSGILRDIISPEGMAYIGISSSEDMVYIEEGSVGGVLTQARNVFASEEERDKEELDKCWRVFG